MHVRRDGLDSNRVLRGHTDQDFYPSASKTLDTSGLEVFVGLDSFNVKVDFQRGNQLHSDPQLVTEIVLLV